MEEFEEILRLLEGFLGKSYRGLNGDLQAQFDCPVCSANKGLIDGDGKHNLEVSLKKLKYNCWVCGESDNTRGRLSTLVKKYGSNDDYKRYKELISRIKQSIFYQMQLDPLSKHEFDCDEEDFMLDSSILLPEGFKRIKEDDKNAKKAIEYLKERGIQDWMIKKYNIGYVGYSNDFSMSNRIVIPSKDSYDSWNYWVGRDYLNDERFKFRQKYKNPTVSKTSIIFNEGLVNWWGDVTLVEGPFDHICVPNSIPMLGKVLKPNYLLYQTILKKARANINIFLDDDAYENAKLTYKLLNQGSLRGRVYIVNPPDGWDAALIFQHYGYKGIARCLRGRFQIPDYKLL